VAFKNLTIQYDTINYIYVRPTADEQPAFAAQNQQTKGVMKKTLKKQKPRCSEETVQS